MGDNPGLSHVGSFDYNSMARDYVESSMRLVFLDCYYRDQQFVKIEVGHGVFLL